MKKFLLLVCLILSFTSYAKDFYVGWELWFPYQYRNSQQELVGLDFEIFDTILAKVGYTTKYIELPWKRHLHYIKTGEMDVAMGASLSEDRRRYAMFSEAYRQETVNLFVRNGQANSIKLGVLSDLTNSNYMIGIESGYYYGDEYQELIKTVGFQKHIVEVVDIEENVTLLLAGHIDGFLVDPATIKAFSDKYKMVGEFEKHALSIYQADIHIIFSKKSVKPEVVTVINQAIGDLKKSGELDKIINKWNQLN
jgi:polar amino acid transport system substrate-binding protein